MLLYVQQTLGRIVAIGARRASSSLEDERQWNEHADRAQTDAGEDASPSHVAIMSRQFTAHQMPTGPPTMNELRVGSLSVANCSRLCADDTEPLGQPRRSASPGDRHLRRHLRQDQPPALRQQRHLTSRGAATPAANSLRLASGSRRMDVSVSWKNQRCSKR